MVQFVDGPRGQYNLAYIRSIEHRDNEGIYATLNDGEVVALYNHPDVTGWSVIPGNGLCRFFTWNSRQDRDIEAADVAQSDTTIIGWRVSPSGAWYEPICIDQPLSNHWAVRDVNDAWVILGEVWFRTDTLLFDYMLGEAQREQLKWREKQGAR